VQLGANVRCGPGVGIIAARGASVTVGARTVLGTGTEVIALGRGSSVEIGSDVFVGRLTEIAAHERVVIGDGCMLAEMVSIRDHDHDPAFPPRSDHTLSAPVEIGARVWLGAKVTVTRGASVGPDSVIGANAVVTRAIPSNCVAGGVPARVIRSLANGAPSSANVDES
jgi:acetyltransferase-like isoleucine patch superfamily enzyme